MKFYWEINPEDLLKNGNYEKNNLSECAYNLMIMYCLLYTSPSPRD